MTEYRKPDYICQVYNRDLSEVIKEEMTSGAPDQKKVSAIVALMIRLQQRKRALLQGVCRLQWDIVPRRFQNTGEVPISVTRYDGQFILIAPGEIADVDQWRTYAPGAKEIIVYGNA